MKLKDFVLSKKNSLVSNYIYSPEGGCTSYLILEISIGIFVYERPDNQMCVVEFDSKMKSNKLHYCTKDDLLILNKQNFNYMISLIKEHYDEKINNEQIKVDELSHKQQEISYEISLIEKDIEGLKKNLSLNFTENRMKSLAQLEKNVRRQNNKIDNLDEKKKKIEDLINKIEQSKNISIEKACVFRDSIIVSSSNNENEKESIKEEINMMFDKIDNESEDIKNPF